MEKVLNSILTKLKNSSKLEPRFDEEIQLSRLRLKVPLVRKIQKTDYSNLATSPKENFLIWDYVWHNTDIFEVKSFALYSYQYKSLSKEEAKKIFSWVKSCTCWEHSDDLSKIIALITEEHPEIALPILQKWVKSKNKWCRRQALVGMIEYSSKRKKVLPFKIYIKNVSVLHGDSEYYVQKAIGWTLREIYNIYPKETSAYLFEHAGIISPIAFSAATEKMPKHDKSKLAIHRKQLRK